VEDSEIVAAIAAGDPAGLPAAYDKYAYGVYGYCRWMLREPAYAADALVETFVVAATELATLADAIAARALLYTVARAECHRQLATEARVAALTSGPAAFRNPEREAGELSSRHGLSEAELAAVLDVPWEQAHDLAARAREHAVPPSTALSDRVPPQLREQVLRRVQVIDPAESRDMGVSRARSAWLRCLQWLGNLTVWRPIRANPGAAIATAAISAWAAAAASAIFITVTGMHPARPVVTQSHTGKMAATSPVVGRSASPSATASPSPSAGPTNRSVPLITARPSPTEQTKPSQSPSATPSPSGSPAPSSSATPSPSPSATSPSP
jgi:DNA-directed RNA polymerase specialized sigma24 family protein